MTQENTPIDYSNIEPETQPNIRGIDIMRDDESILNILRGEGFIENLKQQLLGQIYDRELKKYRPLVLRPAKDNERVDYAEMTTIINCADCGNSNANAIPVCPSCGELLDNNYQCSQHSLINKPAFRCVYCKSLNTSLEVREIKYHNDAASMNEQGAYEVIGLLLMIFQDIAKIGSQKEWFKLKEQKHLLMELGWLIDSNWRRYEIIESNIEAIKAVIFRLTNSIFNLIVSGDPKSLIEYLTQLRQEQTRVIRTDSTNKKGGWLA